MTMRPRANSKPVRVQLPPKRLTPPELLRLIDLAVDSPQRTAVTVIWADGSRAHATDTPGLDYLRSYPKSDSAIAQVFVHHADNSRLAFEPMRGFVTATGNTNNEAIARVARLRDEYESIPNRRGVVITSKLILRVSLLAILISSALLLYHAASTWFASYHLALFAVGAVVVVGCGAWSEYLEGKIDPPQTQVLPAHSRWYSQPPAVIATASLVLAMIVVGATVFVRLNV
ncbi:MAG TPA: hypothetical protein VK735_00830 [Pseudonocardia sp.]|uniref:hypothetical protein n=1 Tax=Pseudonocardia sp. TaxID=60912 RepID=UPI002C7A8F16|nr:hypothetical protein [Pseudonocardia sp.]HTF45971.1 hypothetical protein [Pseudonocardia sp.]